MSQPKARGEQFAGVSRPIHVFGLGLDVQRWLLGNETWERRESQWNGRGLARWNQRVWPVWVPEIPAAFALCRFGAHRSSHLDCGIIGWESRPRRRSREPSAQAVAGRRWLLLAVVVAPCHEICRKRSTATHFRILLQRLQPRCISAVAATPFDQFRRHGPARGQRDRAPAETDGVWSGRVGSCWSWSVVQDTDDIPE